VAEAEMTVVLAMTFTKGSPQNLISSWASSRSLALDEAVPLG